MADMNIVFTQFIDQNFIWIAISFGMLLGFLVLYRMIRKVPPKPDFIKVFRDQYARDESLNLPSEFDARILFRGHQLLGKIVGYDVQLHEYVTDFDEKKFAYENWRTQMSSLVFIRPKKFIWFTFYVGKREILLFKKTEAKQEGEKLVFPSDTGFTALGSVFVTKTSFKEASSIIEGVWSKRLFEANVNVMASKMSHIAQESPEMAHELNLKRLEIERIKAEKDKKVGQLI